MKTYEAPTIADACQMAASDNNCTLSDLEYKIVQYPKKGIFGLFSKEAIIEIIRVKKIGKETTSNTPTQNTQKEETIKEKEPTLKAKDSEEKNKTETIKDQETKEKTDEIVDSFFDENSKKDTKKTTITSQELEDQIKKLFSFSCFDIDTIEVDIEDNTAYIFIDGEDAALLIGKEGYRYNALSYMLFNWINVKYNLYLKLEIAQFLASQQDMIKNLMKPVIEHVESIGSGKTKPLNGILVQIALEYLRDVFPNKYVAIKRNKDGHRYIIINDFNKR